MVLGYLKMRQRTVTCLFSSFTGFLELFDALAKLIFPFPVILSAAKNLMVLRC